MRWLFNLFKSDPQAPELVHPIFGIMSSFSSHDGTTVWQSENDFETSIGHIGITIDGTDEGPSKELVLAWERVILEFDAWKAKAQPKLQETLTEFGHEEKFNQLKFAGFGFYTEGKEQVDWDMSFELESEFMLYTVCFKDGQATKVHADS